MNSSLKALIEDLELNHEYCPKDVSLKAAAELRRLHAENEALRADAERYRWIRRKVCIIGTEHLSSTKAIFDFVNLPYPAHIGPNASIELDIAIDAVRGGKE